MQFFIDNILIYVKIDVYLGGVFMERISVKGTAFVDESGRERIFNGINLVNKGHYDEKTGQMDYFNVNWDEDMFRQFSEKGINLIRFGLVWKAIEPAPGIYNEDYLDYMEKFVDMACRYGIYVYLDVHQDCFHGMPDWATVTDSYKRRKPLLIWAEGYFIDKAVHRAFDNFWANNPVAGKGIQDWFADMWKHVATRFKDKENLFGFDILNEPFPGTSGGKVFKNIIKSGAKAILSRKKELLGSFKEIVKNDPVKGILSALDDKTLVREITSSGDLIIMNFDVDKYYPFMKKISAAIREVTDNGIIVMEACYYSNSSIPSSTPRIKYYNGELEENICFAPHGYDITVDSVYTNTAGNNRVDAIFDQHAKTQSRLGIPVIVGEWGGMVPGSDEYPHLEHLLEYFDNKHWSQTSWCYMDGLLEEKIMDIICRPYPLAVPGDIGKYHYNRVSDTFTLTFSCDSSTRKKAVVYSPAKPYEIISKCKYSIESIENSDACYITFGAGKGENNIELRYAPIIKE